MNIFLCTGLHEESRLAIPVSSVEKKSFGICLPDICAMYHMPRALPFQRPCRYVLPMNILHYGNFLAHGLRLAGNDVRPLALRPGVSLRQSLAEACDHDGWRPDCLVLELWSRLVLPPDLAGSPVPLVGWYIDAPINMYWLEPLLPLFSLICVDQRTVLPRLEALGYTAHWLPLCARHDWFRAPQPVKDPLLFIGTLNRLRRKRTNVIARVREQTSLTCLAGLSFAEAQDRLAAAALSLNENLFPGVTLRIFQSLAAGALPFTERHSPGLDSLFTEGEHYLAYAPHDLREQLATACAHPQRCADMAAAAQAVCRERHDDRQRAAELLALLRSPATTLVPPVEMRDDRRRRAELGVALAGHALTVRYGGSVGPYMTALARLAQGADAVAVRAQLHLGLRQARRGKAVEAQRTFMRACELAHGLPSSGPGAVEDLRGTALLRLAQLHETCRHTADCRQLLSLIARTDARAAAALARPVPAHVPVEDVLPLQLAYCAQALGHYGHAGFLTPRGYLLPESAAELALAAWERAPSEEALSFLLETFAALDIELELYPLLLDALPRGLLSDAHILHTARLAEQCYDLAAARQISAAWRKRPEARKRKK